MIHRPFIYQFLYWIFPMQRTLVITFLFAGGALAQTAADQHETVAVPSLRLTLEDAMARARAVNPGLLSAGLAARIAHEDVVQAKAAQLPSAQGLSQFIYTQPNGESSGVFVSNDGPHVYNDQVQIHGDIYSPVKRADYHRAVAAEALARAKADVAARGIIATVMQNFYAMAVSGRKVANARQSLTEAQRFLDITQKQEQGGEAAHADVVKAQIQVEQRQRDVQDAELGLEKARIGLAVLLFPDYRQDFAVVDDLDGIVPLPDFGRIQAMAGKNNPDLRAAQAAVQQQNYELNSARAARLPSLSFDYFAGINANQFALYNPDHLNNLGYAAQVQLTVPLWTWGAARSKVRQAELKLQQAKVDLTFTQRELIGSLNSFYLEAQAASSQITSLRHSQDLSAESLRLTLLRYQAGEATAQEVVDAQNTLVQARGAYDDGLVRYRVALGTLQTLTGAF